MEKANKLWNKGIREEKKIKGRAGFGAVLLAAAKVTCGVHIESFDQIMTSLNHGPIKHIAVAHPPFFGGFVAMQIGPGVVVLAITVFGNNCKKYFTKWQKEK
jgi:hypothetical protein